jgi:CIC family chloride channel protein
MAESRRWSSRLAAAWRRLIGNQQMALSVLAVVIGAASAYGAIGFRLAIDAIQLVFYGSPSEQVYSMAVALEWWHLLLAPAVGGLGIGLFVHFVMADRRPLGVAEVIEAGALRGGRMRLRDGIGAAIVSAASVGAGASVGREGPVVHLAATMASWVAQRLSLSRSMTMTLLGCAVASGVAASFIAPIAGVFFALEVVVGHYGLGAFAPVVVASVVGTVVARIHLGDFPAFVVPGAEIATFAEIPAFMLLGVVCAGVAVLLMAGIMYSNTVVKRLPLPGYLYPAVGGLAVGAIAAIWPEVIGVGYETTDLALGGSLGLGLLVVLVFAKIAATSLSLGSGFGGGVFSPALCIGALTGAAFGIAAATAMPEANANANAYALVGMGAVAGAVLGAPISTILIIFELTSDYTLTIAVMVAVSVATLIVRQTLGHSFFTWQLARRGIDIAGGREAAVCKTILVNELVSERFRAVDAELPIGELRALIRSVPDSEFYVTRPDGGLLGVLSLPEIKDVLFDPDADPTIRAGDLARLKPVTLALDDDLDRVLRLFDTVDDAYLPVVDDGESRKLVGVVPQRDAMMAYNQALLRLRREERGET